MKKLPFKISDQEMIDIYNETHNLTKTALAAQGTKSTRTVAKKLKSLGVDVRNHFLKPITISDKDLIDLYNSGKTLKEIAEIASGSKGAMMVRKRLQELGIDTSYAGNISKYREKMSHAFHKYTLDENIFDNIDTEEKAYWLGFLYADGYNHEDKSAICLRLQSGDIEILEKFKLFLKSNAPIYKMKRITVVNHLEREYAEVRVNSVHLSEQLAKLGCVQGKTYKMTFPTYIPEELMNHFIRGYFDGNGCICIKKRKNRKPETSMVYQFTIVGREAFVTALQEVLINGAGVKKTTIEHPKKNYAKIIHYDGYYNVLKILNYIYKDATIFLKRKHDKYLEMVTRQSNL